MPFPDHSPAAAEHGIARALLCAPADGRGALTRHGGCYRAAGTLTSAFHRSTMHGGTAAAPEAPFPDQPPAAAEHGTARALLCAPAAGRGALTRHGGCYRAAGTLTSAFHTAIAEERTTTRLGICSSP